MHLSAPRATLICFVWQSSRVTEKRLAFMELRPTRMLTHGRVGPIVVERIRRRPRETTQGRRPTPPQFGFPTREVRSPPTRVRLPNCQTRL